MLLSTLPRFLAFSLAFVTSVSAQAQVAEAPPYGPSQFNSIGFLNDLTVNNQSDLFSGGTITIDGIKMIVPDNSYVTLPSIAVAWSQLFKDGVPQLPQFGSPGITWEGTVIGNRVGDDYIAAVVYIAQNSLRLIQGFVNRIDLETGEFWVSGNSEVPGSGIKCRLNDPVGRYGIPYVDHPLWTVDSESPSVVAETGFPLCIPRYANGTDDPLCPMKNRIIGGEVPSFIQFKPLASRTASDPDPNVTAPLMVGDYVTINGVTVGDLLAVYTLVANLGFYTAARETPAYIRVEAAQVGLPGPANAEQGETRAVAFTTDPSTPMQFYAIDQDPCTGIETERDLMLTQPFGQTAGDVWGKALFRLGKVNTVPATRNYGFKLLTPTVITANGIEAGKFIQPMFDYIMPELTVFGDQMFPFDFTDFPFLGQGSGPFIEAVPGPEIEAEFPVIGQLKPWPGARAPVPTSCPVITPTVPTATTLSTVASATASATPTSNPGVDVVTILSVTGDRGQGVTRYTIQAISSHNTEPLPVLTASGTGDNDLGLSTMDSLGNGNYNLEVSLKRDLDTVTVTSSHGGRHTLTL